MHYYNDAKVMHKNIGKRENGKNMQNDTLNRLTGEITINFSEYGSKEDLMALIDDFNDRLKLNDFDLDNGDKVHKTKVVGFELSFLTLEDEEGEIVDLQKIYIK